MTGYNSRIIMEQGASVFRVASGGSLQIASGGVINSSGVHVFSGGFDLGQGSATVVSGGLVSLQSGASLTVNLSGAGAQTFLIGDGTLGPTISVGRNAPTHSASPGSLYIRSDGSMSNWYQCTADGVSGSVWRSTGSA